MAFIDNGTIVISFAEYDDVVAADARVFDSNEGLEVDSVEDMLIRETERILSKIRNTDWWKQYYASRSSILGDVRDIPTPNPDLIIDRKGDFTDLCVWGALSDYMLPKYADIGNEEDATFNKISFYKVKFDTLFNELIESGDWYDFDEDGTVETTEKFPITRRARRIR